MATAKKNRPSDSSLTPAQVLFKIDQDDLLSGIRLANPHNPSRVWYVKEAATVYPVVQFLVQAFTGLEKKTVTAAWNFTEGVAHVIVNNINRRHENSIFDVVGKDCIFVQFNSPIFDAGYDVMGFVVRYSDVGITTPESFKFTITSTPSVVFAGNHWQTKTKLKEVTVAGSAGKSWVVSIYDDHTVSCNCPSWTKSATRTCKHMNNVAVLLELTR